MRPRALALLVLAGLALFHAREAVFAGRAFYVRDLHLQWYGQIESFVRTLHAGSPPLWDPWVSFGQPMLANPNAQVLYPLTWLNLLMRPWTYYTVYLVAHLLLAGLGAFSLARRLGASSAGAVVAAALWTSSGPFLSLGNLWNHLAGAAWLPWTLDATLRALDAPSPRRALAWGATLAAAVLAGSPDFAVLNGLFSAAFVLVRPAWSAAAPALSRRRLLTACAALVFAAGLSAAQALPSTELAVRAERWNQSAEERTYWSLHPAGLVQTLVPVLWTDLPPGWSTALNEGREPYLFSVFLGLPVLTLALVALQARRDRDVAVLCGGGIAGLLLALGRHGPFYGAAVAVVPLFEVVRFPSKLLVVATCALALLAGLGYDAVSRGRASRFRLAEMVTLLLSLSALAAAVSLWGEAPATGSALLIAAAAGACSLVLLARARRPGAAAVGLALLAVLPAAWLHRSLNPTAPTRLFTARPQVLDFLDQAGGQRLFVYDYDATPGRSRERLGRDAAYLVPGIPRSALWLEALGKRLYLLPPVGAAFGVRDSFGRDPLGIQPTPLARLNATTLLSEGTPAFARLLRLGAVNQVLALHDAGPDFRLERTLRGPFLEDMRLYRIPDPLPRALVVSGARVTQRPFDALLDPALDPSREVVLPEGEERAPLPGFEGSARIVEDRPDRVRLATSASSDAWLVLMDAYDPGWKASVDGTPVKGTAANVAFRAVPLPAGPHTVELRYRPSVVLWGAVVTIATGLAALLLIVRSA